ncbi:MAG: Na+/H+ antiporter subunit E [Vescimonas sp.]
MLMCVFLFLLWLIFNGRVTLEICLFGIVVTGLVYAFCVAVLGYHPRNERRVLRRLGRYLQYGVTLVWEIVKANVQTMKVILSPKAAYRPAVVRLQVPLEEASSRVLAVQLHHPDPRHRHHPAARGGISGTVSG